MIGCGLRNQTAKGSHFKKTVGNGATSPTVAPFELFIFWSRNARSVAVGARHCRGTCKTRDRLPEGFKKKKGRSHPLPKRSFDCEVATALVDLNHPPPPNPKFGDLSCGKRKTARRKRRSFRDVCTCACAKKEREISIRRLGLRGERVAIWCLSSSP